MDNLRVFVTQSGQEITLRPIATETLDDLQVMVQQVEKIRPPTYSVSVLGEDTEEVEHDSTTLKTDEDKAAWTKYINQVEEASAACNLRVTRTYLTFGIDMEPPDDGWEEGFEFCGIPIPEKPIERKAFYFERAILSDPLDQQTFVQQVYLISQLSGEALDRADAIFQRGMESWGDMDTPEEAEGQKGEVEA